MVTELSPEFTFTLALMVTAVVSFIAGAVFTLLFILGSAAAAPMPADPSPAPGADR